MRRIQDLQQQWQRRGRYGAVLAGMCLEDEGLFLGARTRVAKRSADGGLAIDSRLVALLSVAYGEPLDAKVLARFRLVSKHTRSGDKAMAAMHVALAGLPQLTDPTDAARRLFIADALIEDGIDPRDIFTALAFDPAPLDALEKFDPEQPRVPAGNGRPSGRWVSGDAAAEAAGEETAPTFEMLDAVKDLALEALIRAPGPVAFFTALLYATPAGGKRHTGEVPGHPELRYAWNDDEADVEISRVSDGKVVATVRRGPDGKIDIKPTPAILRLLHEHDFVDPDTLPPEDPRSSHRRDDPQPCPLPPMPDKKSGPQGVAYANYMKQRINEPPTPPGYGYRLYNPFAGGDPVNYDDCDREIEKGTLIEYKGPGYAVQFEFSYAAKYEQRLTRDWLDQATRQVEASGGRPIIWYFAEERARDHARQIFAKRPVLRRIRTEYAPFPEGTR